MSNIKKIALVTIFLLFFCGCVETLSVKEVVNNSPYTHFVYLSKDAINEFIKENPNIIKEKGIPEDLLSIITSFMTGIYINKDDQSQIAIKTPLWMLGKLYQNENIIASNGYILINTKTINKPNPKFRDYLPNYNDIVSYDEDRAMSIKIDAYTHIGLVTKKDEYLKKILKGLKSIGKIKVINTSVIEKDGYIIANITCEPISLDINYLKENINLDLKPPITVNVVGWEKINENEYKKGLHFIKVYILPVNKETMKELINEQITNEMGNIEKVKDSKYKDWNIEEYMKNNIKTYIGYKEVEYGTVCIITDSLNNLDDVNVHLT
ncbi:hypothetical protein [Methanotorris igneus]|uniref:Uncharacterized protein n=1 Tax=Methanotorris igneus (strain DSM 5666 / JCM 11834 / Kol 5) TaxID=880724 RepID=F6BAN2_METIK|nr:hypothetical protein [Methanotorris igneus]AEF95846.1 hypothetical protein Metig_0290 [Methanotorris igneus Kol 5]